MILTSAFKSADDECSEGHGDIGDETRRRLRPPAQCIVAGLQEVERDVRDEEKNPPGRRSNIGWKI